MKPDTIKEMLYGILEEQDINLGYFIHFYGRVKQFKEIDSSSLKVTFKDVDNLGKVSLIARYIGDFEIGLHSNHTKKDREKANEETKIIFSKIENLVKRENEFSFPVIGEKECRAYIGIPGNSSKYYSLPIILYQD